MATYTTNLNLKKPAASENYNILDWNNNSDTIDAAYGTLNSQIVGTNLGTFANLSALESALDTLGSSITVRDSRTVWVQFSSNASPFSSTGYSGTFYKVFDNRYRVAFYMNANGYTIEGWKTSSGWVWDSFALNSQIAKVTDSFTPTFSWSAGGSPTVGNISMSYIRIAGILFVTGRFNITNKNSPANTSNLVMSLPSGFSFSGGVGNYGLLISDSALQKFVLRVEGSNVNVVDGPSGNYSAPSISTGYYGITLWIPVGF